MIKNIILDVGKVLVEWDPKGAFLKLGFSEEAERAVANATVASADWNEMDRSVLSDEAQLAFFISKAPAYEKEIRRFWDNIGLAITQYPYSRNWISDMKKSGYHVYILSNYARWTYSQTQEQLSFLRDVDGQLFSFEVNQIKPEADIYQTLLRKFDLVAEECLFLDDRLENIEAARAQGINGIVFTNYDEMQHILHQQGITW